MGKAIFAGDSDRLHHHDRRHGDAAPQAEVIAALADVAPDPQAVAAAPLMRKLDELRPSEPQVETAKDEA